ncbi:hypothetical protein ACIRQY_31590 [Streptomyces sp. NPDC101490]|uniref:hypothetical protein n=1 Tax=unclassified Streptomyces TaxID=2593676 RepID=UPI00332A3DB0
MSWYLAVPSAVLAVLLAAAGTAALRSGWVPPWQRRYVHRTALFGQALLVLAVAFAIQACGPLIDDPGTDSAIGVVKLLVMLGGFVLVVVSQRPRPNH